MKTCPYCNSTIPENESSCPQCGKEYWDPDIPGGKASEEKREEEEEPGCLQVIVMPLIIALLSVSFLISCGVIINLFADFESNQVKIAWLLGSGLIGLAVYFLLSKNKKKARR
jgi:uncharacterized membrane protein YvbJ